VALFASTICGESPFPWSPAEPPGRARVQGVASAARMLEAGGAFRPFSTASVVGSATIAPCLAWPAVPAPPPIPAGPAPAGRSPVPTLVVQGAEDTRTPLEQGIRVAEGYSDVSVLQIPFAGHSPIGADPSGCAPKAEIRFLAGAPAPKRCPAKRRSNLTPVTLPAPRTLRALGKASRRARTRLAAKLTVADALLQLRRGGPRVGGLRGGRASVSKRTVTLRGYRYLRGVRVTGRLRPSRVTLRVSGGGASPLRIELRTGKARTAAGTSSAGARWDLPGPRSRLRVLP